MVYSGYDEIRFMVEKTCQCKVHAIGRRTIHAVTVLGDLVHTQRRVHGQRITGGRTIAIRRNDDDIGNCLQCLCEYIDAGCKVAVVVAYEDFHILADGRDGLAACDALTILEPISKCPAA